MSFLGLLVQTVTVVSRASTTDDYGNTVLVAGAETDYPGRIEALATVRSQEELILDRETALTMYRLFTVPEAVITPTDEIREGGITYRVQGQPAKVLGRRSVHHIEAFIQRVDG